ncbi:MAG: PHP domain-containing protein [Pseudomonadota bacterium]
MEDNSYIDLHCHSTASDGSLSPGDLVRMGRDKGLKAIAITDHDTVEGVPAALEAGIELGFEVVPGVEISAEMSFGTMHILGYYVDHNAPGILVPLNTLQNSRETRNHEIVKKLRSMHMEITYDEVLGLAQDGQVGRPHFARLLLQKGFVSTIQDAFDNYLKKGRPAYVDKFRFDPAEAIRIIKDAGGMAVLAHPGSLRKSPADLETLVSELKSAGLNGLEVIYSDHTNEQTRQYQKICSKFGLLATGGTDYHGSYKPEIAIGRGRGGLRIPYELLAEMKKARQKQ